MTETQTILFLVILGFLATEPWRWLGVFLSKDYDEDHEVIKYVRAISTALIAALVMRLIFSPPGVLSQTELSSRLIAIVTAMLVYLLAKQNILLALSAGILVFLMFESALV